MGNSEQCSMDFNERSRLEAAALEFHQANPRIYQLFCRFALEAAKIRDHYSVAAIWERIRWHIDVETREAMKNPDDDKPLKLNNNHKAYYVRLFNKGHPHLDEFFRTRRLVSKLSPTVDGES